MAHEKTLLKNYFSVQTTRAGIFYDGTNVDKVLDLVKSANGTHLKPDNEGTIQIRTNYGKDLTLAKGKYLTLKTEGGTELEVREVEDFEENYRPEEKKPAQVK